MLKSGISKIRFKDATAFQVLDATAIHKITKKFDAVFCGFCMPYLSKKNDSAYKRQLRFIK